MLPGLSIVIPSHNRPDLLRACLTSVIRYAPPNTQVLVVDDASPDAVISRVATDFSGVEVIRLPQRGGFCIAANTGITAARQPIVELLNDDTEVCLHWAENALAAFADPRIAAVAPLVLCWPGVEIGEALVDSAGDRYHPGGYAGKIGHGEVLAAHHLRPRFVFGASASSAFYRREVVIQIGAFPESFGAYFEDVDLSFRLNQAGFRVWYEPASRVLHHVSASYGSHPGAEVLARQSRNEELVYWRNMPGAQLLFSLPLHLLVLLAKGWRRWREGELAPFLRGRFAVLRAIPEVLRDRQGK
jgi:GT2 family glycosyltransferase